MKNQFVIDGEECVIELHRRDGTTLSTWINASDLPRVSSIKGSWVAKWSPSANTFYVHTGCPRKLLHRWILKLPKGRRRRSKVQVDHDDHNGLNNRRSNLITCSNAVNGFNRKGPMPNTVSGIRGVSTSRYGKWLVRATYNKKEYYAGYFTDIEEAKVAAEALRRKAVAEALV